MEIKESRKCCFIGIPDHQAILNIRGRLGAAQGPAATRAALRAFSGFDWVGSQYQDLGDASAGDAAKRIADGHAQFGRSLVVGGTHDHVYSQLKGVLQAVQRKGKDKSIGCINIDAHLDLRSNQPLMTSGSGFFVAIEEQILSPKNLVEFAIQKNANSQALWSYAEKKKIPIVTLAESRKKGVVANFKKVLSQLHKRVDQIVLSVDLDAVSEAYAPGVSAPQVDGLTPQEIREMLQVCRQFPKVTSLGVYELNPLHDPDGRTARLSALLVFDYLVKML